jgi:hypothetical protein
LAQIHAGRKRKIADYQASNTNASSTLPTEKKGREDLAWIMCVLQMATRQLALLNKTGQVDFEINIVCRSFTEWIRNIVQLHFQSFFGATLFLSYDRAIAGYVTRQVATTFMATCARHYTESESITEANTKVLLDMETAPLTVISTNLAIGVCARLGIGFFSKEICNPSALRWLPITILNGPRFDFSRFCV